MSHTPEPWHQCDGDNCGCGQILGPESVYVATVKDMDDSKRIIACVNACIGLDTVELECFGLGTAVGTRIVEIIAQRDELLSALEAIKQAVEYTPLGVRGIKAVEDAKAIITKIKGGEACQHY